jgi:hypothetical protein
VLLPPSVLHRLNFPPGLIAIDQLAALRLQEAFFDMGHRGQPFISRPAFRVPQVSLLIGQIPGQRFLNQFICIAALFGGAVLQFLLQVGGEMHFHCFGSFCQITTTRFQVVAISIDATGRRTYIPIRGFTSVAICSLTRTHNPQELSVIT